MKPREAVTIQSESGAGLRGISSRLAVLVLPVSVVSLLVGILLVWSLTTTDTDPGFSWLDVLAIAVAVVVLVVAVGTVVVLYVLGRSMSQRIGEVSSAAQRVARKDLVDLLDALRGPDPDLDSIAPMKLESDVDDEIGDLARSLEELHGSLIEVGARQMEALRSGVSSIFVTLARRNSSLVDRQLALLDQLESGEEDPEVLAGFYQLDHLATRMRRNAESLLVLAGSESPRVWAKATDMADVVRAAVSEIDEYQRIEVLALEPARLSGGAVTDVSHLVAELLENAIQFSPPSEMIRVTGLFDMDGYQLSVSDRGVGMSDARVAEMNRILDRPPALGLSVEPTLGMYVVAKLAHRHGLDVELIKGVPGITVKVTIPRDHLEASKEPDPRPWDSDHTHKVAVEWGRSDASAEYPDSETREYVRKMSRDKLPVTDAPGVDTGPDHVIDLTGSSYDEPQGGLPVRTPGLSFNDEDDVIHPVSPGDEASHIKSALAAYDRGRRSAADYDDVVPDHGDREQEDEN